MFGPLRRRNKTTGPRVAVIGAGFAGIAAGYMLRRNGIDDFVILERAPSVGGAWWYNRYPGAEVDTASVIYSLSFIRHRWSRTHAQQPELLRYLEGAIDDAGLRGNLRLNTDVTSATWDAAAAHWILELADGSTEAFDAVISAVGFLNVPSIPTWARGSTFDGQLFHSARWPDQLDLKGRTVAVVGTGSTAVQIVGELAGQAGKVLVFQRQPNWILPKGARDVLPLERERRYSGLRGRIGRIRGFIASEQGRVGGKAATVGTRANSAAEATALAHLQSSMASRPELIPLLRPDYPFNGKRPVINDTFYPGLCRQDVTLVPRAVAALEPGSVVDVDGQRHPVDAVVLATGFAASEYLKDLQVVGVAGQSLHDTWAGDPQALAGITVPGFPNFFIMYGPNTNAGPVPFFLECQARFAAQALRGAWCSGRTLIDTKNTVMRSYNIWVQKRLDKTVWGRTSSYFTSASGRVVTQWPTGALQYWLTTRLLRHIGLTRHTPSAIRQPGRSARLSDEAESPVRAQRL